MRRPLGASTTFRALQAFYSLLYKLGVRLSFAWLKTRSLTRVIETEIAVSSLSNAAIINSRQIWSGIKM